VDNYVKNIYWKDGIGDYRTNPYYPLDKEKRDKWILFILKELANPLEQTGKHRKQQWEDGWQESLDLKEYIPGYFGKYPIMRFNGEFVRSNHLDNDLEYHFFAGLQEYLFGALLQHVENVYEFGCGTGHNLVRMRAVNKKAKLYGLDWTQSGVQSVNNLEPMLHNVEGVLFDMFLPDLNFSLKPNSAVVTVASLEQLGTGFEKFVHYVVEQKPDIVVHIEPFQDLLNPDNLLDYLSLQYMKKRNYIDGYVQYLQSSGKAEIIMYERSYIGSLFVDGYTILVWQPS
jgi:trans-aconitate methyltransferase